MKKGMFFLALSILLFSCKEDVLPPPKKKVDRETMINILYDLAVLEAARSQSFSTQVNYPTAVVFVKEKYKIDSLTLAENTKYYASDLKDYKKMYEEVRKRLDQNRNMGSSPPPSSIPDAGGVVK
ncbi:DUF4296 domain-containing protein [Flavobacterium sp.]|uniref:DUF4296 domain-containing protein n=1 Tax=Flavobacterium sp. TaxID=239 RepID=UPI0026157E66|nr:DUF4296 domain-containing protein [Flavobacterium sp.]